MERAGLCGRGRRTRPLPDGSVSVELSCLFDSSKVGSALGVLSNVGSWRSAGGCRGVARLPSLCCISRASSLSGGWPKSACPQSETARYPTQFGPHEVQARTLLGRPCSFVRALVVRPEAATGKPGDAGGVYSEVGQFPDVLRAAQQALALATQAGDSSVAETLGARIDYYQSQESKPH